MQPRADHGGGIRRAGIWLEALLFLGLALAVRLPHIDHPGVYDEYYHALAAREWLASGSLDTEDFTYRRAGLWTRCVAGSVSLFGDTPAATRVPSVLAGCALVLATWAFGRRVGGPWAGRVAALLVCLDFDAIYASQVARFYPFGGLLILGAAAALYFAISSEGSRTVARRSVLLACFVALSAVAFALNHMNAIPIAACLAWATIDLFPVARNIWLRFPRWRWAAPVVFVGLVIAVVIILPDPAWLYGYYREAATYNMDLRSSFDYYLRLLGGMYPALCALFPIAGLLAIRSHPRFTVFAVTVFSIGLALHSGAGRKEERFFLWAFPLFFLVLGLGAEVARPHFEKLVGGVLESLGGPWPASAMRWAPSLAFVAFLAIAIGVNPAYRLTPELLATPTRDWPGDQRYHQPARWDTAAPRIKTLLADGCVLVSSAGVKALYHVGRLDYDLLRTLRDEHTPDHLEEFVIDHRTHRPTISEAASLEEIVRLHNCGVVVIDEIHWSRPAFVTQEVATLLEERFESVQVPPDWRMRIYTWGMPGTGVRASEHGRPG